MKNSFVNALKWSFLAEIFTRILQPGIFLILAIFLNPEDFGVMTSALMVIAFIEIFWEAGMSKAVIQRQTQVKEAMNVAFFINVISGFFFAAVLFFSSDFIANEIFKNKEVSKVLKFMSLMIIFASLSSMQQAYLMKYMKFDSIFWVKLVAFGVPGIISIPLAFFGYGYWALVFGAIFGQFCQLCIFWKISDWRPSFKVISKVSREISIFGSWVWLTGILIWAFAWLDMFFVGRFYGTEALGLYRFGYQFSSLIFLLLFSFLSPVLYSHLSEKVSDLRFISNYYSIVCQIISIFSVPVCFFIFIFQEPIVNIFFDQKWIGLGGIMGPLAIAHGFAWIVGMNGEFYRSLGKPHVETYALISLIGIYVFGYLYAINFDLQTFANIRMFLAILALFLHLIIISFYLKFSILTFLLKLFLYTGLLWISLTFLSSLTVDFSTYIKIFLVTILFAPFTVLAALVSFGNKIFKEIWFLINEKKNQSD